MEAQRRSHICNDRAYGKAPTFSSTDTTQFKRAIDMTDDELAAIASRTHLTVVARGFRRFKRGWWAEVEICGR